MASTLLITIIAMTLASCHANLNVTEYMCSMKTDIGYWDLFFPRRLMEQENLTNVAALDAIQKMQDNFNTSMWSMLAFQRQELQTANMMMAGTPAEGCVNGISNFLQDAIDEENDNFVDCTGSASSRMKTYLNNLSKIKAKYTDAYSRVMNGIQVCAKTYPNHQDEIRLKSCVTSMKNIYDKAAKDTQEAVFPSISMNYFHNTVVSCSSTSALAVSAQGVEFLSKLVNCAKLSGDINVQEYEERLSNWPVYVATLPDQIELCQTKNYDQILTVEKDMVNYYTLQKEALENYVIESRGQDYYKAILDNILEEYFNTLVATQVDNPGDAECVLDASNQLNKGVDSSSAENLACDVEIVANTKELIGKVIAYFTSINGLMPAVGNAAILSCFSQNYIFADNTIANCFHLTLTEFDITYGKLRSEIEKYVTILQDYIDNFFGTSGTLPCGPWSTKTAQMKADYALYNAQRCMYMKDGNNYAVTTPLPIPSTTTTTQAPTTSTPVLTTSATAITTSYH